ncbi:MAG: hypothetical protein ACTS5A_02855, partial [Candidatus Hodgkinia cicadicola]
QLPMNISAAQPQWINLRKITSVSTSVTFYKSFTSERLFIYYLSRAAEVHSEVKRLKGAPRYY